MEDLHARITWLTDVINHMGERHHNSCLDPGSDSESKTKKDGFEIQMEEL